MDSGPENPRLQKLLVVFRKHAKTAKAPLYGRLAELLVRRARLKHGVNIAKISRFTNAGDVVAIPCKVLSLGDLKHAATIYAFSYSSAARQKIAKAGGSAHALEELAKAKPDGSKVRIII
jgi:large subunit ribosomal protein L18e